MDNFHEQLIKTSKTSKYTAANTGFYVCAVLALALISMVQLVPFVIFAAAAAGLFFLKKKLYIEYEYYFTNGEIDIDTIMEMKTRKRILSFNAKDIEIMAPEKSNYILDYSGKPQKEIVLCPNETTEQVYVAIISNGGEKKLLKMIPDEEFIELCYKYNPRAVKRN